MMRNVLLVGLFLMSAGAHAQQVELQVDFQDQGAIARVTSRPKGLHCPPQCSATFARGSRVRLEVRPYRGVFFAGWGIPECGNKRVCTIQVDSPLVVRPTFMIPETPLSPHCQERPHLPRVRCIEP